MAIEAQALAGIVSVVVVARNAVLRRMVGMGKTDGEKHVLRVSDVVGDVGISRFSIGQSQQQHE